MRHYLSTLLPVLQLIGSITFLGVKAGPLQQSSLVLLDACVETGIRITIDRLVIC